MHMTARKGNGLQKWEYPASSGIYIREIINQNNGAAYNGSFQVVIPAKVTGVGRKRFQFSTKEAAKKFAQEQYNGSKEEGQSFFTITEEERRQFAYALPKLRDAGITINEAVEHALKTLRSEDGAKTIDQIVDELIESKCIRFERGDLSERSFRDFRHRATVFAEEFKGVLAAEFQMTGHADIKQWLLEMDVEPRTTKNYLNITAEILKYAIQKRYMVYNPLDCLTDSERKELCGTKQAKEPCILSVTEADRLLQTALETDADLGLLGAVVLGLFCGIRTEEIKRLKWDAIKLDEGFVTIGANIAKKRRIRHVTLPESAKLWLTLANRKSDSVVDNRHYNHYQKRFKKLRLQAGFEKWNANAMRHSFGTYHYALNGNSIATARELGHKANDTVLFDHYRALTTKDEAEKFFGIIPKTEATKIVSFAS